MIIVDANLYDLEGIADCAERFFEYAGYADHGMPLDRESFKRMVTKYIQGHICLLLKDSEYGIIRGGICGSIIPWGYNEKIKIAVELFYWVDEEYRGINGIKLIKEYEKRVEERGAKNIMIQPETHLTEKIGKLYEKRGYKPFERFWIK